MNVVIFILALTSVGSGKLRLEYYTQTRLYDEDSET